MNSFTPSVEPNITFAVWMHQAGAGRFHLRASAFCGFVAVLVSAKSLRKKHVSLASMLDLPRLYALALPMLQRLEPWPGLVAANQIISMHSDTLRPQAKKDLGINLTDIFATFLKNITGKPTSGPTQQNDKAGSGGGKGSESGTSGSAEGKDKDWRAAEQRLKAADVFQTFLIHNMMDIDSVDAVRRQVTIVRVVKVIRAIDCVDRSWHTPQAATRF